jgi:hypothetical protein
MGMGALLVAVELLANGGCGNSGEETDSGQDASDGIGEAVSSFIQGGLPTNGSPVVMPISYSGETGTVGSGVVVSPCMVLTAKHVVDAQCSHPEASPGFAVWYAPPGSLTWAKIGVEAYACHPSLDVAALRLEVPLDAPAAVLGTEHTPVGARLLAVGYGWDIGDPDTLPGLLAWLWRLAVAQTPTAASAAA